MARVGLFEFKLFYPRRSKGHLPEDLLGQANLPFSLAATDAHHELLTSSFTVFGEYNGEWSHTS